MKTLVLYYSYSGHTRALAQTLAQRDGAAIAEIQAVKTQGKLLTYVRGGLAAIRYKPWPIRPLAVELTDYEAIHILSPVWASHPAPPVIAALQALPRGKTVSVTMVSGSGGSGCRDWTEALLKEKGCTLKAFTDVKA